jgi:hypothetical protein
MTSTSTESLKRRPGSEDLAPAAPSDHDLEIIKRELAAAKGRFIRLAEDAEHTREHAAEAEALARARLEIAADTLRKALSQADGPALRATVENALASLVAPAAPSGQ